MKLACCSWSYHRAIAAGRLTFDAWLRRCAEELRVDGVDIIAEQMPARGRRGWLAVKKRCADWQLTIVSLSPGNDFGKPAAASRRTQVDAVKRWIEAAVTLGAPRLRIFAGWPPRGKAEVLWPKMVACIRQVERSAAQAGVILAIEPHNEGGFLPDSRRTLKLIRQIHSPWVRINLDTGNYAEPDPYAGLEASMPYAAHVVAKIHRLNPQGDEVTLHYGKIFAMLKRHRYHGFLTVEYEGEAEERREVPRAVEMLRRYAARYGV